MFRAMPLAALLNNRIPDALPIGLAITFLTLDTNVSQKKFTYRIKIGLLVAIFCT
jgi:hypothetical protein